MNLNRRKYLFVLKYEAPCKSVVLSLFIFGYVLKPRLSSLYILYNNNPFNLCWSFGSPDSLLNIIINFCRLLEHMNAKIYHSNIVYKENNEEIVVLVCTSIILIKFIPTKCF
jgi:hypothetical protein